MNRIAVAAAVLALVPVARAHAVEARAAVFAPDGKSMIVASSDKVVRARELPGGKELWKVALPEIPTSLGLSPDGKTAAAGCYGLIFLLEAATGKELAKLEDPIGHMGVNSIAWSPDGKTFVAGGDGGEVRLFDAAGKEVRPFKGHEMIVNAVAFFPDGKTIATGCVDKTVRLWDVATGKETQKTDLGGESNNWVSGLSIAPDGKTIAAVDNDGAVHVLDAATGKTLGKNKPEENGWAAPMAFTPDGKSIMVTGREGIRFLDAKAEKETGALPDHKASLTFITFSKDGKTAAYGDWENVVMLVELSSKKETPIPAPK